jgi:hypothetical protein
VREIAQQQTSPRHSGSDTSAAKSAQQSAVNPSKKTLSKVPCSYYGFLFISAVRFVSIPTLYLLQQKNAQARKLEFNSMKMVLFIYLRQIDTKSNKEGGTIIHKNSVTRFLPQFFIYC